VSIGPLVRLSSVRVVELANLRCFQAIHESVTILLQFPHPWQSEGFNMGAFTSGISWPPTSKQLFRSQFSVRFSTVQIHKKWGTSSRPNWVPYPFPSPAPFPAYEIRSLESSYGIWGRR